MASSDLTAAEPTDEMAAKSTKSPAFQFYPKEFLSSTKVIAMSATERGAYITLLSMQWLDGSLPNDIPTLARLVGIKERQFTRMWPVNLGRCFTVKGNRLVNERLEKERQKQALHRQRQSDNAASGWQSRRNATASKRQSQSDALHLHSPSPVSDLLSANKRERGATLVQPRRGYAAWEGQKGLYVPQKKHNDFVALRNHSGAEKELLDWYGNVADKWQGSPGADMLKFWTDRFNEQWPSPSSVGTKKPWGNWRPTEAS